MFDIRHAMEREDAGMEQKFAVWFALIACSMHLPFQPVIFISLTRICL